MRTEAKATLAALLAGLGVVGASYGMSALVAPHEHKQPHHSAPAQNAAQNAKSSPSGGTTVTEASLVTTGREFYAQSCASCHGASAGGGYGPNLHGLGDSDTEVATVIKNGVQGKMPAFGGKYNAKQQQALVAYVQSLRK